MSGHELLKHENLFLQKVTKPSFIPKPHMKRKIPINFLRFLPVLTEARSWPSHITLHGPFLFFPSRIQQQEDNTPSLRPQAGQLCPAHWGQIFFSMSGSFSPDFSCHYCLLSASLSGFLSFLVQTQLVFPVALTTPSFQWAPDVLTWNHSVSSSFSLFKSQCLYHCYVIVLTLGGAWGGWTMTFSKQRRRLLFILSIKA